MRAVRLHPDDARGEAPPAGTMFSSVFLAAYRPMKYPTAEHLLRHIYTVSSRTAPDMAADIPMFPMVASTDSRKVEHAVINHRPPSERMSMVDSLHGLGWALPSASWDGGRWHFAPSRRAGSSGSEGTHRRHGQASTSESTREERFPPDTHPPRTMHEASKTSSHLKIACEADMSTQANDR